MRIFGAAAVVPSWKNCSGALHPRWIDKSDFLQLPALPQRACALISALLFGLEHNLWLAGVLAGLAYGGLYLRSNAVVADLAHAVTTAARFWVIATGSWAFGRRRKR